MDILLTIHIAGAALTGVLCVGTVARALLRKKTAMYENALMGVAGFQTVTGVLLVISGDGPLAPYCVAGAVYVIVVAAVVYGVRRIAALQVR